MSNVTIQMKKDKVARGRQGESRHPVLPAWRIILSRELSDLWIGGKALYLILAFSVLLGIQTFVLATNFELSLFTPQEMVLEALKSAIQVSALIGLIIGADSISGERERSTLEILLLSPASRRQIVLGKFLAALSAWPVALAITVPFMFLLSQGGAVFGQAILWGAFVGFLLIPAFTAIGVIVSLWCNSNKTSFLISLGIFIVFILVGQVLGTTKIGLFGQLLQWLNPIPAGFEFLSNLLVNHHTFAEIWTLLESPFIFSVAAIGLLFFYFSPGFSIESGGVGMFWSKFVKMVGLAVIACFMLSLSATTALALSQAQAQEGGLQMSISLDSKTVKTGDTVTFDTVVTNTGAQSSNPIIVAMNIINLSKEGDVVDPEDWSPERTQYIDSLASSESTTLSWTVNAVLDGNFMIYLVAVDEPQNPEDSSQIAASPGLHLTVTKFTSLNPSGVLPYAIGIPIVVLVASVVIYRLRRRSIDLGGEE